MSVHHPCEPMRTHRDGHDSPLRRSAMLLALCLNVVLLLSGSGRPAEAQPNDFSDIVFVSPDLGWMLSADYVLQTTDGGQNWAVRLAFRDDLVDTRVPQSLQVVDPQHVWVLYNQSRLLRTQDGGLTWQAIDVRPTVQDGGLTVKTDLKRLRMITADRGYGLSFDGEVFLRTVDGGQIWRPQPLRPDPPGYVDLDFLDLQHGWLAGPLGLLARTTDGGQTWQSLPQTPVQSLFELHFRSLEAGWILADDRRLFRTTDGGQNWQQCAPGQSTPAIRGLYFHSPTLGWAIAETGVLLKTADGCATWQVIQTPVTSLLISVHFLDPQNGWLVGENNTVLKTTDGGLTWTPMPFQVP